MNKKIELCAPAKINLFLHITGQRTDGYHQLQSVFQLIDWYDIVSLEFLDADEITRPLGAHGVSLENDLVVRAARLLKKFTSYPHGVKIHLEKNIPMGAGLGGGSSDAASVLIGLNRLWDLNLSQSELMSLGLELGADVPFFLRGRNAWVEGIGEKITPIDLPAAHFWVIKPPTGLETSQIFAHPDLKRDTNTATISVFAAQTYDFGHNDLQAVAQNLCPGIGQAIHLLNDHGLQARMTGSGSAVFALCKDNTKKVTVPDHFLSRFCSNMEVHPLSGWASSES